MVIADPAAMVRSFIRELHRLPLDRRADALATDAAKQLLTTKKWNSEQKLIQKMRVGNSKALARLRKPCQCKTCQRSRHIWPFYYLGRVLSFECWLEMNCRPDADQRKSQRPVKGLNRLKTMGDFNEEAQDIDVLGYEGGGFTEAEIEEELDKLRGKPDKFGSMVIPRRQIHGRVTSLTRN